MGRVLGACWNGGRPGVIEGMYWVSWLTMFTLERSRRWPAHEGKARSQLEDLLARRFPFCIDDGVPSQFWIRDLEWLSAYLLSLLLPSTWKAVFVSLLQFL